MHAHTHDLHTRTLTLARTQDLKQQHGKQAQSKHKQHLARPQT